MVSGCLVVVRANVCSLAPTIKGDLEQRAAFMFVVYDHNESGCISTRDVQTLLEGLLSAGGLEEGPDQLVEHDLTQLMQAGRCALASRWLRAGFALAAHWLRAGLDRTARTRPSCASSHELARSRVGGGSQVLSCLRAVCASAACVWADRLASRYAKPSRQSSYKRGALSRAFSFNSSKRTPDRPEATTKHITFADFLRRARDRGVPSLFPLEEFLAAHEKYMEAMHADHTAADAAAVAP